MSAAEIMSTPVHTHVVTQDTSPVRLDGTHIPPPMHAPWTAAMTGFRHCVGPRHKPSGARRSMLGGHCTPTVSIDVNVRWYAKMSLRSSNARRAGSLDSGGASNSMWS